MKLFVKVAGIRQFRALKWLLPKQNAAVLENIRILQQDDNYSDYTNNIESNRALNDQRKALFFDDRDLSKIMKGIYFGSDTCEHLLPYIRHVIEVMKHCQHYKLHFVFVFPPISSSYSKHAHDLLLLFNEHKAEVVVNDFGMLTAAIKHKQIKVSLGRLMNRVQRNAFVDYLHPSELTAKQLETQQHASMQLELAIPTVRRYFKGLNIGRFGIENMPYNAAFTHEAPRMNIDVYYPYIYLSSSRACDTAGIANQSFAHSPQAECARHCEKVSIDFSDGEMFDMIHRNNAFYRIKTAIDIPHAIVKQARNRLVYEIWL